MEGASVLLDGVEIKSFWGQGGGLSVMGTSLGIEAIAEFHEMTSTFNAQYNGLSVVNEVTRSGTNTLHGSAYGFFRNSAMDARGFFDPLTGPPPCHRYQFGGALGGGPSRRTRRSSLLIMRDSVPNWPYTTLRISRIPAPTQACCRVRSYHTPISPLVPIRRTLAPSRM